MNAQQIRNAAVINSKSLRAAHQLCETRRQRLEEAKQRQLEVERRLNKGWVKESEHNVIVDEVNELRGQLTLAERERAKLEAELTALKQAALVAPVVTEKEVETESKPMRKKRVYKVKRPFIESLDTDNFDDDATLKAKLPAFEQ